MVKAIKVLTVEYHKAMDLIRLFEWKEVKRFNKNGVTYLVLEKEA